MSHEPLYTAAQTRELDRLAIEEAGLSGIRLMARAGRAAFELLLEIWPQPPHLHVLCGSGNNGGDGYILAALAQARGIPVTVYTVGATDRIRGDALIARERALAAGVPVQAFNPAQPPLSGAATAAEQAPVPDGSVLAPAEAASAPAAGVLIDALLGTGLSGPVREAAASAITWLNQTALPVMSLDIPSGLCSDTGRVLGTAVRADYTVTFIGMQRGLFSGAAAAHVGGLHFTDLEIPAEVYQRVAADCHCLQWEDQIALLPPRPADAHKGQFGHVLVVGGERGMAGAALLAAEAAARCGAGLVSAATRAEHVAAFVSRRPEVMTHAVDSGTALLPLLQRPNAIAVGPGLGRTAWAEQLWQRVSATRLPLVVDADALNLLARQRGAAIERRDNWILTPHPGEAARLLDSTTAAVQADRFAAARALQARCGGVLVLKGAGTLICSDEGLLLSPHGNPGMASGGMGDVLSGVLAALLAQGLTPLQAACLGVCLHGRAGDLAAQDGSVGLLATDLMPHLRALLEN